MPQCDGKLIEVGDDDCIINTLRRASGECCQEYNVLYSPIGGAGLERNQEEVCKKKRMELGATAPTPTPTPSHSHSHSE